MPSAAPAAQRSTQVSQSGELHLEVPALARHSATLLVPALCLILFAGVGAPLPFMLAGIVLATLAILVAARIFSDRLVLRYDPRSVRVTGLLGSGELLWLDMEDVSVRTYSRFNLRVLFTSGARRNLVISAQRNSLGGPTELLIPVDLLGLDREELVALVTNLLCCRAAGGDVVPSWQGEQQPLATAPAPSPAPSPAGNPRDSFDPDAIMARYLAERQQVVAENRPDLQAKAVQPARVFGRKSA